MATGREYPPETRYARNGMVHLAYQVLGSGPVNLVAVASVFAVTS